MQLMCSIQQVISRSSTPTLTRNHQFNFISLQSHFRGYSARKGIPSPTDTATPGSGQGKLVNKPSSELQTVSGMSTWELPLYNLKVQCQDAQPLQSLMAEILLILASYVLSRSYLTIIVSQYHSSTLPPSLSPSLPVCHRCQECFGYISRRADN